MTLLRVDASIRPEGSVSREVADTVEQAWSAEHPDGVVVRRELGLEVLTGAAWTNAVQGQFTPEEHRTPEQLKALALGAELADELFEAQAVLAAVPLYNFGVPQQVKAWIDLLFTDSRLGPRAERPLDGKPLVLVVARGGGYGEGTPRAGWDHSTPYLRRIFGDVWGFDVHLVEAELTLAGVNPAMEALRPLAAESLRNAHTRGEERGRTVAGLVKAAA